MLSQKERLTRAEFMAVPKTGKRFKSEAAALLYIPGTSLRGAVIVSKKVSKSAVQRNRLRRVTYGLLGQAKQRGATGTFVITLLPEAKKMTNREFQSAVQNLIERTYNHA